LCTGCACQLIIKENDDDDDVKVISLVLSALSPCIRIPKYLHVAAARPWPRPQSFGLCDASASAFWLRLTSLVSKSFEIRPVRRASVYIERQVRMCVHMCM